VLLTSIGININETARMAGVEVVLNKPVRQSQLHDALTTMLGTPTETQARPSQGGVGPAPHATPAAEVQVSRGHVLLAEDYPVNQVVAIRMLERSGYRVDAVNNGREAVEAFSNIPYGAVLMDVQMPEMDGYEATAEIRRREGSGPHTPIIAMTADAMQGDRERALAAGMDDYIAKPVEHEELEAMLERWIPQPEQEPLEQRSDGAPGANEAAPALDLSVLESRRGPQRDGEPDKLARIVGLFIYDVPIRLDEMRQAVERRGPKGGGDSPHAQRRLRLYGGSSNGEDLRRDPGPRRLRGTVARPRAVRRARSGVQTHPPRPGSRDKKLTGDSRRLERAEMLKRLSTLFLLHPERAIIGYEG
jgi:two-component system, sensor histidine kinase and response regulator